MKVLLLIKVPAKVLGALALILPLAAALPADAQKPPSNKSKTSRLSSGKVPAAFNFDEELEEIAKSKQGKAVKCPPKFDLLSLVPQIQASDAELPASLRRIYRRDAARLSMRLIINELPIQCQSIEVPTSLQNSLYNALVAIRTSKLPQVDSLAKIFNIRTFPSPNVSNITLIFSPDVEWAMPLRQKADTAGLPQLNALLRK